MNGPFRTVQQLKSNPHFVLCFVALVMATVLFSTIGAWSRMRHPTPTVEFKATIRPSPAQDCMRACGAVGVGIFEQHGSSYLCECAPVYDPRENLHDSYQGDFGE